MKVEFKEITKVVRELTLTVEADVVKKDYNKALKKVSKVAPPIAGFRKGKAPMSAVERNYSDYIQDELYREAVDKYLKLAIEEHDIKSISEFYPQDIKWEKGEDFVVVFKFEVQPEVEINNIDGIKVPFTPESIDSDVEKYIEDLREKNSQMLEVNEAVQYNDSVEFEVSYKVMDDDTEEVKAEVINSVVYETQQPDELSKDSIDKKIGESFETKVASFKLENYKGEEELVAVTAMVNSIQRKQMPELNEAFAKECDYDTVEAMKEGLIVELQSKNDHKNKESLHKTLIQSLVRENEFEVPNIVVANEAYRQAKMYSQGQEPDEQMIKFVAQMVTPQIKEVYLVEKLKEMFPSEVTEVELAAYMTELAALEDSTVDEFKEEHKEAIEQNNVETSLKVERIFADLVKRVSVIDAAEYAKEQEALKATEVKAIEEKKSE